MPFYHVQRLHGMLRSLVQCCTMAQPYIKGQRLPNMMRKIILTVISPYISFESRPLGFPVVFTFIIVKQLISYWFLKVYVSLR